MWDRIFTASLVAYSLGLVVFLTGNYVLDRDPVILTGIALMGITGVAMGVSGLLSLVLAPKSKIRG